MAVAPKINVGDDYKERFGFFDPESYVFKAKRGLNEEIVREISFMKQEPDWVLKLRLRALSIFRKKPTPTWGADLSVIDFENIFYYLKASDKQGKNWDEVPDDIKKTFDRLGVPRGRAQVPGGRLRAVRVRSRLPLPSRGAGEEGRHLPRHGLRAQGAPRPFQGILRHRHPGRRQQVLGA